MGKKGEIEVLLLLSCLVGVVAFISFAMGNINLVAIEIDKQSGDQSKLAEDLDKLVEEKSDKAEALAKLKARADELRKKIKEAEHQVSGKTNVDEKPARREEELRNAEREAEELARKIKQKKIELLAIRDKGSSQRGSVTDDEIKKLRMEADRLEELLRQKEKEVQSREGQRVRQDPIDTDINSLRKQIDAANKRQEELKREAAEKKSAIGTFNPWRDFRGTDQLKNPLFAECRKEMLVLHPSGEVLDPSKLRQPTALLASIQGHDGIVFLVRPDGMATFQQGFQHAKKTNLKIAYEPVDSDRRLDFLKGRTR